MRRRATLVAALIAGCTGSDAADLGTLPAPGYVDLEVPLDDVPGDPVAVFVGDLEAYDLRQAGDVLTVTVQGGPAGPAVVTVQTDELDVPVGTVTFEEPVDPLFDRVVAFGASLTQGTRDAVPTESSQLAGAAMQMARAANAYFPQPILTDPLVPMGPGDVDPETCQTPDTVSFIVNGVLDAFDRLKDPVTEEADLRRARVTPELEPWNVAVGNAPISFQRVGYRNRAEDVVAQMLSKLTLEARGNDLFESLEHLPIDRVVDLEPTLVLSFDLWGNDAIYALFAGTGPEEMEDPADVAAELDAQIEILEATGAVVVLAALPDVSLLPGIVLTADEKVDVRARVEAYNAAARERAATRDWLTIAPLDDEVDRLAREGLTVGDVTLTVDALGGLLSLDGLHFTDTGYAMSANVMLDTIDEVYGVDVPRIDLEAVYATDTRSPQALLDAGVPAKCLPTID